MSEAREKRRRKVIEGIRQKFGDDVFGKSDRTIKRDLKAFERTGDRRSVTAVENGRVRRIRIRVKGTDIVYPSMHDAAKALGLNVSSVSKVVRGFMKHTKGYEFERVEG